MNVDSPNLYFNQRKKCPICTSRDFINILTLPYHSDELSNYLLKFYGSQGSIELDYLKDVNYSLCKCQTCKGIFQKFIPNDYLMEKLYDEWISPEKAFAAHKEKINNSSLIQDYKGEITTIKEAFYKFKNTVKVLDFGMGWGTWAGTAKDLGCEVHGVELSTSRIEYASKKGINVINLSTDNFQKFDFINTEQVFEHLPEPLITLKNLKQWLKNDGIIKISVPTAANIDARLRKMDWSAPKGSQISLNPVAPLEHINFFKKESIIKMAHLTGLEEIKIPVRIQYKNTSWDGSSKDKIKKSVQPIKLNFLNDLNYVFLRRC